MREVLEIILLLVLILSIISSFIALILYFGICMFEKLFKSKHAIATCPRCNTTVIKEYYVIKPRMWTCPYCQISVRYRKTENERRC